MDGSEAEDGSESDDLEHPSPAISGPIWTYTTAEKSHS